MPNIVKQNISNIMQRTSGMTYQELLTEHMRIFGKVRDDQSFTDDESRHRWSSDVLWNRNVSRKPTKSYTVIPVGFDGFSISKRGMDQSSIYVAYMTKNGLILKRIACQGKEASRLYRGITLFAIYKKVRLSDFGPGSDLQADDRAYFENPTFLKEKPREILENRLKIPRVELADVGKYLSKMQKTSTRAFVDRADWRCVRGIVSQNPSRFPRKDGTEGARVHISNRTVGIEQRMGKDGRPIMPGITIWLPPELLDFEKDSECDFYGTLTKVKRTPEGGNKAVETGEIQMNCSCVLPVHIFKREEED